MVKKTVKKITQKRAKTYCKKYCKNSLKTSKVRMLRSMSTMGDSKRKKMFDKEFMQSCQSSCFQTLKNRNVFSKTK